MTVCESNTIIISSKVVVHVINIQHPRNVHFSNNYFITTAIYITVWGK